MLYKNVTKVAEWADRGNESFFFNHHRYDLKFPERIKNLLLLYEILMRALQKIVPYLESEHLIVSDNILEDLQATKLMG